MRFTSQHKAINQKEYGKAVSPLRYDSLALILCRSIFVVYGKQSEKNKYICSSKRHSALHTFWGYYQTLMYNIELQMVAKEGSAPYFNQLFT
jgi:hypothetical protein